MLGDYAGVVSAVAFSPAAPVLAVHGNSALDLWDVSAADVRRMLSLRSDSPPFCFTADGRTLPYADGGAGRVFDLERRGELAVGVPARPAGPVSLACGPDGRP